MPDPQDIPRMPGGFIEGLSQVLGITRNPDADADENHEPNLDSLVTATEEMKSETCSYKTARSHLTESSKGLTKSCADLFAGTKLHTLYDSEFTTARGEMSHSPDRKPETADSTMEPSKPAELEDPSNNDSSPHLAGSTRCLILEPEAEETHDDRLARKNSHITLWRTDIEQHSFTSRSDDNFTANVASVDKGQTRTDTPSDVDEMEDARIIQHNAMAQVSQRLRGTRQMDEQFDLIDAHGKKIPGAKGLYLVGDRELRDVVKIVIDEAYKARQSNVRKRRNTYDAARSRSLPRLDANAIIVPSVTIAGPATTISLPKTSFANLAASDMKVHTKTRGTESSTMTTIVSRQSVAEITWSRYPEDYHSAEYTALQSHSRAQSDCCPPINEATSSWAYKNRRQSQPPQTTEDFVLRHYSTSQMTADFHTSNEPKTAPDGEQGTGDETVITSFPALLSRHCTGDGLSTPTNICKFIEAPPQTLYQEGVDAHCGNASKASKAFGKSQKLSQRDHCLLFGKDLFSKTAEEVSKQGTGARTPLAAEKRLGASLGAHTNRRRSTQAAGLEKDIAEQHGNFLPSLMDKIRQGSHKVFHRHHSRGPSEEAGSSKTIDQPQDSPETRSRNSIIRERTPEPSKPDSVGIYEAMTGTRLNVPRHRGQTCSEDNRPHVCEDELLTPSTAGTPLG